MDAVEIHYKVMLQNDQIEALQTELKETKDMLIQWMEYHQELEKRMDKELGEWGDRVIQCEKTTNKEAIDELENRLNFYVEQIERKIGSLAR